MKIFLKEIEDYIVKGSRVNIVNPQTITEEGLYGKYLKVYGKKKLDLTRLDYLSLGSNQKVREIMIECIQKFDISNPCSQVVMKSSSTVKLENALADFHKMQSSLVFQSGYSTNENMMLALGLRMNTPHLLPYVRETGMGKTSMDIPSIFFVDDGSHFSVQYTTRIAKIQAKDRCFLYRFPSMNYEYLIKLIKKSYKNHSDKAIRIIISDTLSSISGRIFDVESLCSIAEEYDRILYLDEAYAIGTLGEYGNGITSNIKEFNRYRDRLIIMGTLTKAVSQLGGYVTMSNQYMSLFLRACSPQYIFSAPVPPWMAEAIVKILALIRNDFGKRERKKLSSISEYLRNELIKNNFNILGSNSQIVPVLIGDDIKCKALKQFLEQQGFITALFIYPSVKKGEALIRFSLCSDIDYEEVDRLIGSLILARKKICF